MTILGTIFFLIIVGVLVTPDLEGMDIIMETSKRP